jgi:FMN phosphatase YigB (HAD superfamily)
VKIFIDFDDVIFNTRRFKADFQNIFSQFGITDNIFAKSCYNYPPNKKSFPIKTYILEKHLEKISQSVSFNKLALGKSILNFLKDTRQYVFPDVKNFLKKFSPLELFLISHGKQNFQRKKIKNTQLESYFSAIRISSGQKSQAICPLIKRGKEKKFFLDDRVHYIEEVKKCLPEIATILIQRPEGRYSDRENRYCDFTAKNLKEALKIISKFKKE